MMEQTVFFRIQEDQMTMVSAGGWQDDELDFRVEISAIQLLCNAAFAKLKILNSIDF